jgi:hypothetical protein
MIPWQHLIDHPAHFRLYINNKDYSVANAHFELLITEQGLSGEVE